MEKSDPFWLRKKADMLRNMSLTGDYMHLKVALLKLADEFDQEAAEIEVQAINIRPVEDSRDSISSLYS